MTKSLRRFAIFFASCAFILALGNLASADIIGDKLGDQNGTGTCTCNGVPCPCTGGTGDAAVTGRMDLGVQQVSGTGLPAKDLRVVVGNVISVGLGLIGVIMLVIIIYAGFLWMTAGGDSDKVADAKKWIFGAVIGLIIILCAYAITQFVISRLMYATTAAT